MSAVVVLISTVVATAQPAAADSSDEVHSKSWAYTDAWQPTKSFPDQAVDAPVGARIDPDHSYHLAKSYFTVDVPALRGARILTVRVSATELAANDCTKPRSTELWTVSAPAKPPTWADQPRELAKQNLLTTATDCVVPRVRWDVTQQVADAVRDGTKTLTFAMRMPADKQGIPAYGRMYANRITLQYEVNWPPDVPGDTMVEFRKCADGHFFNGNSRSQLTAYLRDPDFSDQLSARLRLWPADDPADVTERVIDLFDNFGYVHWYPPDRFFADGRTYVWTMRAEDGQDSSAWSPECTFTMDLIAPDKKPEVSSSDYPENAGPPGSGGAGIPGRFTLGPNGVPDVVGYYVNGTYVAADRLGGGATVDFAPQTDGPVDVAVSSVDRAGHRSPTRYYRTWVADTGPDVSCPATRLFPFQCGLKAGSEAASFTYRLDNGPETTIPAVNGQATVYLNLPRGYYTLYVWTTSNAGVRSGFTSVGLDVQDTPFVHSDDYPGDAEGSGGPGVPGEFVFKPGMQGVVTYDYTFDPDFDPQGGTVLAGPDGSATVTLTPARGGFIQLWVTSVAADGTRSREAHYQFLVNG